MMAEPLKLLVDTNVWVDYYVSASINHAAAVQFVVDSAKKGIVLYVSSISLKDVFQLIVRRTKKEFREEGIAIDGAMAAAIEESAWSCVRNIRQQAVVVPIGSTETLYAETWRDVHGDFEDDLILAAAKRAHADYVVTSDGGLLKHAPLACVSLEGARLLLGEKA